MEAVAAAAGVGKPAIYRRLQRQGRAGRRGDRRAAAPRWTRPTSATRAPSCGRPSSTGFPARTGRAYVGLIGGLIAEHERHPELIEAFRRSVLCPRRPTVLAADRARAGSAATSAATSSRRPRSTCWPARSWRASSRARTRARAGAAGVRHLVGPRRRKARAMIDFTIETRHRPPRADVFAYVDRPRPGSRRGRRTPSRRCRRATARSGRHAAARGPPRAGRQGARVARRGVRVRARPDVRAARRRGHADPRADDVRADRRRHA